MKVSNNRVGNSANANTAKTDSTKKLSTEKLSTEKTKTGLAEGKNAAIKNSANVNVSDRAQMMQKAKEIASDQTIDEAKVARLQKMIDEGKYKTDAASIADRLVDAHLEIPD